MLKRCRVVVVAAACVSLVACSGGSVAPTPTPLPSVATSTPPVSSPAARSSATPEQSARDKAIAEAKAAVVEYVRLVDEASKNPDGSVIPDEIGKYVSEAESENYLGTMTVLEAKGIRLLDGETKVKFLDRQTVSKDLTIVTLIACLDASNLRYENYDPTIISQFGIAEWEVHHLSDGWILTEVDENEAASCDG